jgi:hypothetical protein
MNQRKSISDQDTSIQVILLKLSKKPVHDTELTFQSAHVQIAHCNVFMKINDIQTAKLIKTGANKSFINSPKLI